MAVEGQPDGAPGEKRIFYGHIPPSLPSPPKLSVDHNHNAPEVCFFIRWNWAQPLENVRPDFFGKGHPEWDYSIEPKGASEWENENDSRRKTDNQNPKTPGDIY